MISSSRCLVSMDNNTYFFSFHVPCTHDTHDREQSFGIWNFGCHSMYFSLYWMYTPHCIYDHGVNKINCDLLKAWILMHMFIEFTFLVLDILWAHIQFGYFLICMHHVTSYCGMNFIDTYLYAYMQLVILRWIWNMLGSCVLVIECIRNTEWSFLSEWSYC